MTTGPESPASAYDILVDFNDMWINPAAEPDKVFDYDSVAPHVDAATFLDAYVDDPGDPLAAGLTAGRKLVAGDGEGNTCPAVVTEVEGARIVLKLDIDKFQAAVAPPEGEEIETTAMLTTFALVHVLRQINTVDADEFARQVYDAWQDGAHVEEKLHEWAAEYGQEST
jgi:hypothetical protein